MRLGLRLTVVFGLVGLITLVGGSTLAYVLAADETRDSIDSELLQRLAPFESLAANLDSRSAPAVFTAEASRQRRPALDDEAPFNTEGDTTQFQIVFGDGSRSGQPDTELTDAAMASLSTEEHHLETVTVDDTSYRVLTISASTVPLPDGTQSNAPIALQLYRDITNEEQALSNLSVRLAIVALCGVAAVVVTCWLVGRWIARPVIRLAETAEHLAELDDVPGRVEIRRNDEIGRLADSYNRLMSAIEVSREQQRRLVADASHELRTPLTSLRMRVEYLADQPVGDDAHRRHLRAAVADAEQLSALVSDLVDLAADVHTTVEEPEPVQLDDLVEQIARRSRASSGRVINTATDATVAAVRPTMVRRAIQNLVDNAIKYSPRQSAIAINQYGGSIEVHDAGDGIATEDADHVFDRFFRSPKARTRPGNGIGLAVVKQVADAHHGRVWVATSPFGGATVGFSVADAATDRSGLEHQ